MARPLGLANLPRHRGPRNDDTPARAGFYSTPNVRPIFSARAPTPKNATRGAVRSSPRLHRRRWYRLAVSLGLVLRASYTSGPGLCAKDAGPPRASLGGLGSVASLQQPPQGIGPSVQQIAHHNYSDESDEKYAKNLYHSYPRMVHA